MPCYVLCLTITTKFHSCIMKYTVIQWCNILRHTVTDTTQQPVSLVASSVRRLFWIFLEILGAFGIIFWVNLSNIQIFFGILENMLSTLVFFEYKYISLQVVLRIPYYDPGFAARAALLRWLTQQVHRVVKCQN